MQLRENSLQKNTHTRLWFFNVMPMGIMGPAKGFSGDLKPGRQTQGFLFFFLFKKEVLEIKL